MSTFINTRPRSVNILPNSLISDIYTEQSVMVSVKFALEQATKAQSVVWGIGIALLFL